MSRANLARPLLHLLHAPHFHKCLAPCRTRLRAIPNLFRRSHLDVPAHLLIQLRVRPPPSHPISHRILQPHVHRLWFFLATSHSPLATVFQASSARSIASEIRLHLSVSVPNRFRPARVSW